MLEPHRVLEQVKSRRRALPPVRLGLRGALGLWKTARRVPLVNRARVTVRANGHRMRVRLFSYDDLLTISDDYEPCLRGVPIEPGAIVVDAGAFIGRHALEFARAVGPAGRVVAVEPVASNFALLRHNVAINGYPSVTCVRCALGASDGETTLSYGRETSIASAAGGGDRRERVPLRRLDGVLDELGIRRIDFLKVDVEGAELDLVRGAERVLAASPECRLAIEAHGRKTDKLQSMLHEWLSTRGYHIKEADEAGRRFLFAAKRPGIEAFNTRGAEAPTEPRGSSPQRSAVEYPS
jgi:FkbM family methyltransferase